VARSRVGARSVAVAAPPKQAVIRDDLQGGKFEPPADDVRFEGATVRNVDFSGLRCWRLAASASVFEDCNFNELKVQHGPLGLPPPTIFRSCSFDRADLRNIEPGHARFERCTFKYAKIENWFAYCAEFVDCVFAGEIAGCTFSGRPFECSDTLLRIFRRRRLDFRGNDFRGASFVESRFVLGIDLDAQLLPEDGPYLRLDDALERIAAAQKQVVEWDDADDRREVLAVLEPLADDAEEQEDLFLNRADFSDVSPRLQEALWEMLVPGATRH
jgi:uncharacterized protein YjbI with pentapeptide repeats